MLIVGSGFHKQIIGHCSSPLSCWKSLIIEVAKKRKLSISHLDLNQPTLAWESMITALVCKDKSRLKNASRSENELRKNAVEIISEETKKHTETYHNHYLGKKLRDFHGHIVNLNFDHLLDQLLGIGKSAKAIPSLAKQRKGKEGLKKDSTNLYTRWRSPGDKNTVWHPHGTIQRGQSLRLGLRDYGLIPMHYYGAFQSFKAWERSVIASQKTEKAMNHDGYQKILQNLKVMDFKGIDNEFPKSHDHWVTRFMLSDVMIIGAGISTSEIGLRWLLVQRQRNLTRIHHKERPKTISFLADKNTPTDFLNCDVSSSWDQAWSKAISE